MKIFTYHTDEGVRLGIKVEDVVVQAPISVDEFYAQGLDALSKLDSGDETASMLRESNLTFAPVVPNPGKIFCVGYNYAAHVAETKANIPDYPTLFSKLKNTLAGANEPIPISPILQHVDYEAELAVVIGKTARNVSEDDALNYVLGYTIANDLSERELQFRTSQFLIGKTPDKFLPLGPYLITADEIEDPQNLSVKGWFNGELRQDGHTSNMIFPVKKIISYITQYATLNPGDVILTGTPAGVIKGFPEEEQRWIQPGDEYAIEIEQIGRLVNKMVAG